MSLDFPTAKLGLPRKWVGEDVLTVPPDRISFSPEFDEQIVPQASSVWNFTQRLSETVLHEHFNWTSMKYIYEQWQIQDFPEVGGANIRLCQISPKTA